MDDSKDQITTVAIKETYLWKAKLAQETNRYEDMAKLMKLVVETGVPTTKNDDNMLMVAYKRVLDTKRSSKRILLSIMEDNIEPWEVAVARQYRDHVDGELRALCNEMLTVVRGWLCSEQADTADPATGVFYWKLCGDYGRYMAEAIHDLAERSAVISESLAAYEQAEKLGREKLQPVDPVRLGLMLNYSVFLYQVCQQRQRGHDVAKRAYENAVNEIDKIDDRTYNDSKLILRLIRDNLSVWIQENGGESFDGPVSSVNAIMLTNSVAAPSPPGPPPVSSAADANAITNLSRLLDNEDL